LDNRHPRGNHIEHFGQIPVVPGDTFEFPDQVIRPGEKPPKKAKRK
jgi:hypothetical protein